MDVAWVGVVGGAVGGVIAGCVSLGGQSLGARHRQKERVEDRVSETEASRRADFVAALEATARLRAAVVQSALDSKPDYERTVGNSTPLVDVAQPLSTEMVADFLAAVHRLNLHGVEIDVETTSTDLFDYMRFWTDVTFRREPGVLLLALSDVGRRVGEAYRREGPSA